MKAKLLAYTLVAGLAGAGVSSFALQARGQIGVLVPPPERLQFRLVGDEPIATADGRSIVTGYKVMVFKDTGSGRCYVTFIAGASLSATSAAACP